MTYVPCQRNETFTTVLLIKKNESDKKKSTVFCHFFSNIGFHMKEKLVSTKSIFYVAASIEECARAGYSLLSLPRT
jgi:hypothetical protein